MKRRKALFIFLSAILVFACNLPAAIPTPTPSPIPAASLTPTAVLPTLTATVVGSTVPFASPNDGPLNCRSGPGTNFQVVVVLNPAQSAEVVGKNPEGTWWHVKNPSIAGSFCWISVPFANITGDASGVQVVAIPPTPTNVPNAKVVVTHIEIFVDPQTTHVGGCIGPIQPISVSANIQTNGAIKLKVHFKDEQTGNLGNETLNFKQADTRDVSDSFTPPINEGTHKIFLVIEGQDLTGLNAVATYKITC